jgi:hypothetical protein
MAATFRENPVTAPHAIRLAPPAPVPHAIHPALPVAARYITPPEHPDRMWSISNKCPANQYPVSQSRVNRFLVSRCPHSPCPPDSPCRRAATEDVPPPHPRPDRHPQGPKALTRDLPAATPHQGPRPLHPPNLQPQRPHAPVITVAPPLEAVQPCPALPSTAPS